MIMWRPDNWPKCPCDDCTAEHKFVDEYGYLCDLSCGKRTKWINREFGADGTGATISGRPMDLADALIKLDKAAGSVRADINPSTAHMFIVNPLKGRRLASLFSTHPSTKERVRRLSAMH